MDDMFGATAGRGAAAVGGAALDGTTPGVVATETGGMGCG